METRQDILRRSQYENEILELIDNRDDLTRSDLQGAVMAIVMKIEREAQTRKV